ncbi:alpha/beta hydrolase family protein [Algibacillus agarilyticus]|uniref:alpha/beta hydrolase family protein n=1 Tax=Algibacillus agarilyticus TaxID=2234133 RepID=UPI000DD01C06|nr:prolyl oligopeptidase family serine peptidase [Algibacillus agarilyticus]
MKILISLFIFICSTHWVNSHELIPLRTLISLPSLSSASLNPSGELLLTSGYVKGNLNIEVTQLATRQSIAIFNAKDKEGYRLRRILWIDDKRAVFETFRHSYRNTVVNWLVTFESDANSVSHRINRINATGYIIDPLVDSEDEVLFAHIKWNGFNRKLKIYRATSQQLVRDNFRRAEKFDNLISDAFRYRTDPRHTIRFTQTYDKEAILLTQWYLDDENEWQELYQFDPTEYSFNPIGFLENGQLAVITNIGSDLKSLYEFDVNTQQLGKLIYQHDRYDLDTAEFDQQGHLLLSVSYYDAGELQTEYFDRDKQKLNNMADNTFKGQQHQIVSQNKTGNKRVLRVFSSANSGDIYLWNTDNNTADFLASQYQNNEAYHFRPAETLNIPSEAGHQIEAFLTQPAKAVSNDVLLVMPHGGPVGVRDLSRFRTPIQYLVNRGYSVLQVNYRGSEGYGKKYLDDGRGQFGQNIEKDITTAVNFIHEQYEFKHTCAIGGSYGGYSSVMLAVLNPTVYRCVIARFGVFDLPLIFNDRNIKIDEHMIKRWERVVGKNDEKLLNFSPVYFAEKIKVPVLITAGAVDTRASFEHSNRLKYVLTQLSAPVEHLYYRRSAHGHLDRKSARHELAYIDDFIRRTLKLSKPVGNNVNTILKDEMKLIAMGFENADIVGIDKEKAQVYKARSRQ